MKMGLTGSPATLVTKYLSMLHNVPEGQRSQIKAMFHTGSQLLCISQCRQRDHETLPEDVDLTPAVDA
jgi:hypothetical protein